MPIGVANAVMVGLAREKEKRWSSAREFATALRQAMGLPVTGGTLPSPRPSAPTPATPGLSMMLGETSTPASTSSSVVAEWKAPTPAVQKSNTTMWALIIIGAMLVFGGCCVCTGVLASASEQAQQDEQNEGP